MAAIACQEQHTLLAGGAIFNTPATRHPWADEQQQRKSWDALLRRLKMRHRESTLTNS